MSSIADLIIEECIPTCEQCPAVWVNEHIKHRILCRCKICGHNKIESVEKVWRLDNARIAGQ